MCDLIGNRGLEVLAKALPSSLENLDLDLQMCTNISNSGVAALGRAVETLRELHVLRLNFEFNKSILSLHGLAEGMIDLPKLLVLDLDFGALDQLNNKEVSGFAKVLPQTLHNLSLSFQQCIRIDDASAIAIADRLPPALTILNLNFKGCPQISNPSVEALAQRMPQGVLKLHFNFEDCQLISEAAIVVLVRSLPFTLLGAKLSIQGTAVPEDKQKVCRRLDRMRQWVPPVKNCSASHHHKDTANSIITDNPDNPLFLRSISHVILPKSTMTGPPPPPYPRPHSTSSSKRPQASLLPLETKVMRHRKASSKNKSGRSPSKVHQKGNDDHSEENRLVGTLHRYFHNRTSTLGWSAHIGSQTILAPTISRPEQVPASVYWATSPEAMFMRPRTLFQGLSEPVWRPLARG
jgi:hypothetical protein